MGIVEQHHALPAIPLVNQACPQRTIAPRAPSGRLAGTPTPTANSDATTPASRPRRAMGRQASRRSAVASRERDAGVRDLVCQLVKELVPALITELAAHADDNEVLVGGDEDELTQIAAREETRFTWNSLVTRPEPPEVAVARSLRAAGRGLRRGRRGHPTRGNELIAAPATVPQEQQAELRVVDGTGVDPALHLLEAVGLGIEAPGGIVLGSQRLPELLFQIAGRALTGGALEGQPDEQWVVIIVEEGLARGPFDTGAVEGQTAEV